MFDDKPLPGLQNHDENTLKQFQYLIDCFQRKEYDLVAVGRVALGDAGWARKVLEGQLKDITPFAKAKILNLD